MHDAIDIDIDIDIGLGAVNIIYPLLDITDWPDRSAAAQHVLDRLNNEGDPA